MLNQLEKFDEAIRDCEKAIELNPNFVKVIKWIITSYAGIFP